MDITTDTAASKLHKETQRIKSALADAETALQAAQAAASTPRPAASIADAGALERARLTDLTGATSGCVDELTAANAAAEQALADWRRSTAAASEDAKRHTAAVTFHREALAECRRLELAALSSAASKLQAGAEAAYIEALQAVRTAAVELIAARAVAGAASRQRTVAGTSLEHLTPIDPAVEAGFAVPSLGIADADWNRKSEGVYTSNELIVKPDELSAQARTVAETMLNKMKGRAS